MNRNACISSFLAVSLAALAGCSGAQQAKDARKPAVVLEKIQGKAQVMADSYGTPDSALNAGGSATYLWQGMRRYSLFFTASTQLVHGSQYVVEGIDAQKVINDIGDPDQGRNGYPLQSSCARVVRMAWTNLPFDVIDGNASLLRSRVKRYPARPVLLVTSIRPATPEEIEAAAAAEKQEAADAKLPVLSVPAEKQCNYLVKGAPAYAAPLWKPEGGEVRCPVVINSAGKIAELGTGMQLCEAVPWSEFLYQPPVERGKPVRVKTEVDVRFDPRK